MMESLDFLIVVIREGEGDPSLLGAFTLLRLQVGGADVLQQW
jgi:hypothetical protein